MEVIDIDAEGDVVLACRGKEDKIGLRVCSAILKKASPVFKALLAPTFREGSELRAEGEVEIPLPDDDADAMTTICNVLHFRHQYIGLEPPQGQLGRIATLAEKYDLANALRPVAHIWISTLRDRPDVQSEYLLVIAYLLQQGDLFAAIGYDIIWKNDSVLHDDEMLDLADEASQFRDILRAITEQKTKVLIPVACTIERMVRQVLELRDNHGRDCTPKCGYAEKCLYWMLGTLRADGLWPVTELNHRSLSEIISSLETPGLAKGFGVDRGIATWCHSIYCAGVKWNGLGEKRDELVASGTQLRKMVKPLCYQCVREGKVLDAMCRH